MPESISAISMFKVLIASASLALPASLFSMRTLCMSTLEDNSFCFARLFSISVSQNIF